MVALPLPQKLQNKFEICKDKDGELSDIRAIRRHSGEDDYSTKNWGTKWKIPYKVAIHLYCGSSTRSLLCCRSWIGIRTRKNGNEYIHSWSRKTNISCTMRGVQCVSTTMPAKLKIWAKNRILNSHVRNARKNSYKGIIENQEESLSLRDACLGKPRSLHSQWLMKSQLMEQVLVSKIKMDKERWSLRIFEGFRTQTTNWWFFLSRWWWSDECWFFLDIIFKKDFVHM